MTTASSARDLQSQIPGQVEKYGTLRKPRADIPLSNFYFQFPLSIL